jgi:hypothetical protein
MLLNIEIRKDSEVNKCYNCQHRVMSKCSLLDIRIDLKNSCDLYCPSNIRVDGCGCKSDEELLINGVAEIDLRFEAKHSAEIEHYILMELSKIIPMPIIELNLDKDSSSPILNMYRGEFKTPEASYNFATRGKSIIGWRIKSSSNLDNKITKIKK